VAAWASPAAGFRDQPAPRLLGQVRRSKERVFIFRLRVGDGSPPNLRAIEVDPQFGRAHPGQGILPLWRGGLVCPPRRRPAGLSTPACQ